MNCEGYQGKRLTAGSVIALKNPLMARVNDWTISVFFPHRASKWRLELRGRSE